MKIAAYIFTCIIFLATVQPLFSRTNAETIECCTKEKCHKSRQPEKKKDCENSGCNPFMACASGNFYLLDNSFISVISLMTARQKIILVDDNRVSDKLNECWHPSEIF